MKPILVLYATREGQTKRIVDHLAHALQSLGLGADVHNVGSLPEGFSLAEYPAAIVAASVHFGHYEREMVAFVKKYRSQLDQMQTAFVSVSGAEARVEDTRLSPEQREEASSEVDQVLETFFKQTGWHPGRVHPVAGAILYREYNLLVRFVIKQIAKHKGGDTDTSRNYEYTDWGDLDHFISHFAATLNEPRPSDQSAAA